MRSLGVFFTTVNAEAPLPLKNPLMQFSSSKKNQIKLVLTIDENPRDNLQVYKNE